MNGKRRREDSLLQRLTMCKAQLLFHVIKSDTISYLLTTLLLPPKEALFIKHQSNSKHRARYPKEALKYTMELMSNSSVRLSSYWFMEKKKKKKTLVVVKCQVKVIAFQFSTTDLMKSSDMYSIYGELYY